jgi:hypothetical protein
MGAVRVMKRKKNKNNHRWGNMPQMIGYIEQKRKILTKIFNIKIYFN